MDSLAKHPRLTRRGAVYYFRAKVPVDFVDHCEQREIKFSLKTRDPREALERVRLESVKLDQEFAEVRRRNEAELATSLSDLEADRLSSIFLQRLLEEDEFVRFDGTGDEQLYESIWVQLEPVGVTAFHPEASVVREEGMTDREYQQVGGTTEYLRVEFKAALARGRVSVVSDQVDELLTENFIKIDKTSDAYRRLSSKVLKTWLRAFDLIAQRQRGEVVETTRLPAELQEIHSSSLYLSEVFEN